MPDFDIKQQVPASEIIQAMSNKSYKEAMMRQAQTEQLLNGMKGLAEGMVAVGTRRQKMAQAMATADLLSRTDQGKQLLGTNNVATSPTEQPVTMNQTAQGTDSSGNILPTPIPNKSPVTTQTLATSLEGVTPKDLLAQLFPQSINLGVLDPSTGKTSFTRQPKGSHITVIPKNIPPGKAYIGNDVNGQPLFADKAGVITPGVVPGGGVVLPKSSTMPTQSTRASSEFAETLLPHIDEMRNLIKQADSAGYIGPGAGRVYGQFLSGKVGATGDDKADQVLGKLRAIDSLLKTGALRVHFGARGGQQMYEHFSELLNSGKQSAAMLNGSLDGLQSFMEGYADAGKPGAQFKKPDTAQSGENIKVGRFDVMVH